jgi:hypothetical protein
MGLAVSPRREMAPLRGSIEHGPTGLAPGGLHPAEPRRRAATAVPYLRLVGPDEVPVRIPTQRRADGSGGGRSGGFRMAARPAPIRLTRRGRIVIWVVLAVIALVGVVLLAPASQAAAPPGPSRAVTVHAGDTMWSIASAGLPGVPPAVAIERVRAFNHLATNEVYVGEQILLPPSNS